MAEDKERRRAAHRVDDDPSSHPNADDDENERTHDERRDHATHKAEGGQREIGEENPAALA